VFGPTRDVRPYLWAADAFVFPSQREGMPNAVLEALATGLPLVLSDIAPHRELLAQHPAARARLHVVDDPGSLRAELAGCVADAPAAADRSARATLAPAFGPAAVAARYVAVYREALGAGPPLAAGPAAAASSSSPTAVPDPS
jgi:glycosyltransferase involved in cell wall biosynthesis